MIIAINHPMQIGENTPLIKKRTRAINLKNTMLKLKRLTVFYFLFCISSDIKFACIFPKNIKDIPQAK
jgi:hypothetical protein